MNTLKIFQNLMRYLAQITKRKGFGRTDFGTLTTNQLIQIEKILNIHSEKNLQEIEK